MDHDEAIGSQAAERYVAGELSPAERDAFEEHFFDCPECAEEVRWQQIFAANARAVAREQAQAAAGPPVWAAWRDWFRARPLLALSLAANAALAVGVGYLLLKGISRRSSGPQWVAAYFAPPPARAAVEPQTIPSGAASFIVHFPAPDQDGSCSYEILDAAGKRESAGVLSAPAREPEWYLQIPVGGLSPGVHKLVVHGPPGGEILAQFLFRTFR
jgi:Putative zinc-finger